MARVKLSFAFAGGFVAHLSRIFTGAGIPMRQDGIGKKGRLSCACRRAAAIEILTPRVSCAANAAMNGAAKRTMKGAAAGARAVETTTAAAAAVSMHPRFPKSGNERPAARCRTQPAIVDQKR
ncbi:hypothetical protein [Burkholderia sp. SCN-KJ]|uniref:hypothetical protein n=1 Tax=Burkholderia sp. SCN-KJ TaxID=2969248 RepID=UPI0021503A94|nr:hypothetical protein [Burkholderia sp. SCN-KJ]MCR4469206.1 hypothetical protein [Burkholderia sp. SCN-KJ]